MRFSPKTEAEIKSETNRNSLWPRGTYDFEVVNASDEVSKNGNDMIKLQLKVYDAAGKTQMVWDYLLEALAEKLAHACEAFGLNEQYDAGTLDASDFTGKAGQVVLYIQKGSNGYADKNAVADYVRPKAGGAPRQTQQRAAPRQTADIADEIPF